MNNIVITFSFNTYYIIKKKLLVLIKDVYFYKFCHNFLDNIPSLTYFC